MLERRKRMLGINGKQWNDIQWTDVEEFLNEIEESFFFIIKIVSTFSISSYNFSNCRYILIL